MISLLQILTEEKKINLSALNNLDDEIEKALEELPKNEALLTLALAAPLIIKAIYKIINSLAESNGIDMSKNKPRAILLIQQTADNIDSFVDSSLGKLLGRIIKDQAKKERVIKVIKALVITGMGIAAGLGASPGITDILKEIAPDLAQNLVSALAKKNTGVLVNILKAALEVVQVAT